MRIRLLWVLLLSACGGDDASTEVEIPDDWLELKSSCGPLSLHAPADTSQERAQGIDSCVESYFFDNCTVNLDWGGFSDRLTDYDQESDYEESFERIDGWRARVVQFRCDTLYCAAVNLPTDQDVSVTLFARCSSLANQGLAVKMMRTLQVN